MVILNLTPTNYRLGEIAKELVIGYLKEGEVQSERESEGGKKKGYRINNGTSNQNPNGNGNKVQGQPQTAKGPQWENFDIANEDEEMVDIQDPAKSFREENLERKGSMPNREEPSQSFKSDWTEDQLITEPVAGRKKASYEFGRNAAAGSDKVIGQQKADDLDTKDVIYRKYLKVNGVRFK